MLTIERKIWDGYSKVLQDHFRARGAKGLRVEVWSVFGEFNPKKVTLESDLYESVTLTLEQINLILVQLYRSATTEQVFIVGQALEAGLDVELIYDASTEKFKVSHARRKAVL